MMGLEMDREMQNNMYQFVYCEIHPKFNYTNFFIYKNSFIRITIL